MAESPTGVFRLPERVPSPSELADAWSKVVASAVQFAGATATRAADPHTPQPFDLTAPARAFGAYAAHLFTHPNEIIEAQQRAASDWMKLWSSAAARAAGGTPEPLVAPERGDRRFSDPAWNEEPVFDYLKQAYLLTARRAVETIQGAEELLRVSHKVRGIGAEGAGRRCRIIGLGDVRVGRPGDVGGSQV